MMLIYGSQHLTTLGGTPNFNLGKLSTNSELLLDTEIDSLVATSLITGRNTFTNLPPITEQTLNLGDLTIERFCPDLPTITYEGKTYNTVKIGNQCWLKENLDIGTMIQGSQYQTNNGTKEKYCYDNNPANCNFYGGLYQWGEAMQYLTNEGAQGICPPGWHVPTYAELQTLVVAVNYMGVKLLAVGQTLGTNTTGFSALLAGYTHDFGDFTGLDSRAYIWSSKEVNAYYAGHLIIIGDGTIYMGGIGRTYGQSVRCLKD